MTSLPSCFSVFLFPEFLMTRVSSEFSLQKRRCVFHMNTQQNNKYMTAGRVSGSLQVCENTHCCVGYFLVISGQPVVDLLGKKTLQLIPVPMNLTELLDACCTIRERESISSHTCLILRMCLLQLVTWLKSLAQTRPARVKHGLTAASLNVFATQTSAIATSLGPRTQNSLHSPSLMSMV